MLVHECSSQHFVGGSPLSEKEAAKSEASGKSPCITHQFSIIFIDMYWQCYWQCSNDGGGISCHASVLAESWLHPLGLNSSLLDSYFVCSHARYVQQHPHGFVIQQNFNPQWQISAWRQPCISHCSQGPGRFVWRATVAEDVSRVAKGMSWNSPTHVAPKGTRFNDNVRC